MPAILDRCVGDLKRQGVGESSAFAICTSSLQRSGKLPTPPSTFAAWAKERAVPDSLAGGLERGWGYLGEDDLKLIGQLRQVNEVDLDGAAGLARLSSRVVSLNPKAIQKAGDHPLWYPAILVHEAEHAVGGYGEHEATRTEQKLCGRAFGAGKLNVDLMDMKTAMSVCTMAQGQRELMVAKNAREGDYKFLTSVGFTPKASRKVLRLGAEVGKAMASSEVVRDMLRGLGQVVAQGMTILDLPAPLRDEISKAAEVEFEKVLLGALGSDEIMKSESDDARYYPVHPSAHVTPDDAAIFERFVAISVSRGIGAALRGPLGVVPKIRRAGYAIPRLSEAEADSHAHVVREIVSQASHTGLYRPDGEPTDAHVLMMLHGVSPVLEKMRNDAQSQSQDQDRG